MMAPPVCANTIGADAPVAMKAAVIPAVQFSFIQIVSESLSRQAPAGLMPLLSQGIFATHLRRNCETAAKT
jgi:hypothetical protein